MKELAKGHMFVKMIFFPPSAPLSFPPFLSECSLGSHTILSTFTCTKIFYFCRQPWKVDTVVTSILWPRKQGFRAIRSGKRHIYPKATKAQTSRPFSCLGHWDSEFVGCSREKEKRWYNWEAFLCSSSDVVKEILEERVVNL